MSSGSTEQRSPAVTVTGFDHVVLRVADVERALEFYRDVFDAEVFADQREDGLRASGRFTVVDGPAPRWGAQGIATSLYVRDPDGNTVELRHY